MSINRGEIILINTKELKEFSSQLLENRQRDLMHDVEHAERMLKAVELISNNYKGKFEEDVVILAAYFHGPIHYGEEPIREWLKEKGYGVNYINNVISVTWETQTKNTPISLEGKLLRDAHTLEGGKSFFILKPLLVGTIIGQTLNETISFIEDNIIGKSQYFLPETKEYLDELQSYAKEFIENLKDEI